MKNRKKNKNLSAFFADCLTMLKNLFQLEEVEVDFYYDGNNKLYTYKKIDNKNLLQPTSGKAS